MVTPANIPEGSGAVCGGDARREDRRGAMTNPRMCRCMLVWRVLWWQCLTDIDDRADCWDCLGVVARVVVLARLRGRMASRFRGWSRSLVVLAGNSLLCDSTRCWQETWNGLSAAFSTWHMQLKSRVPNTGHSTCVRRPHTSWAGAGVQNFRM